jgi:Tol biopolymer transport system component
MNFIALLESAGWRVRILYPRRPAWEAEAVAKIGGIALAILGSAALAQTQYESPVWAPDGNTIAFAAKGTSGDWNIERIALDGTHRVRLTQQGGWDPAWSPDGKSVAFVSIVDGRRQISLVSPDGAPVRQLTHGTAENFHPAWSRDGRRIACASAEKGVSRIVIMNADGSDAKPISPDGERARWPTWSPDGRRIAYYVESPVSAIWVADLANVAELKLFDSGLTRTLLDWSPDGKEIALTRGVGHELGIDALDAESGTVRRVLGGELGPGEPRWSPDGKSLLFSTHSPAGIAMLKVSDLAVTTVIK